MARSQLNIILGIDANALQKSLKRVERRLSRFARNIESAGQSLTQGITLPLAAVGGASLAAFGELEKLEKGLTAIIGSTEGAARELEALREVSEAPGLDFQQAVKGSIQLQAVGFSADEARQSLSELAKTVALTGGSARELDVVVRQLTQINSKGRLLAEDLLVIQENAPAIGLALQEAFGTTSVERIRESGISTQEFTQRLIEAIPRVEAFQNVTGGLSNSFENFRNNIKFALAELGRTINETVNLESVMSTLSNAVSNAVEFFKSLTPEARRFIVIAAGIAAAIGPVLIVVGKLVALGPVLVSGFRAIIGVGTTLASVIGFLTSPIGLTIAAIVGLVAAVAALYNRFEDVRRIVNALTDFFFEFYEILKDLARPIAQVAKGLAQAFNRDFAGAAASISGAFSSEVPSVAEAGARLGAAFAGGFNDTSNRLADGIENLKGKIFQQTKEIQQGLTGAFSAPTGGGPGAGGGGGSASTTGPNIDTSIVDIPVAFEPEEIFKVNELEQVQQRIDSALGQYRDGLTLATDSARVFGTEGNALLQVQLDFTRQALEGAIQQFGPYSEAVTRLKDEYTLLTEKINANNEATQQQQNRLEAVAAIVGGPLTGALGGFFDALAEGSKNAFQSFVSGFKKAIFELLKRLAIALAQAIAVAVVLSIIFPGSLSSAGGFGAKLGNLFKQFSGIPGLAQGGIVPPGYPNDTFPARLTSGEAVIPLDKLDRMGGQNVFIPNLTLKGQDLVIAFEKAKATYNRYS